MNSWWKEFSFYSFWEGPPKHLDWDEEDHTKPLIHFSFETWFTETRSLYYYDTCDKGRWRGIHFRMYISRYLIGLTIPFRPLPDHIPTERELKMRAIHDTPEKKAERKKFAEEFFGGSKKV